MDATIKNKIEFFNRQIKMLGRTAADANNYYNSIIQTKYDSSFWQAAGITAGALLVKGAIPKVTISALPELIGTATSASASTELALSGAITTAGGVEVLTGASNAAALANAVEIGTATGASAAGGAAAISVALPYIALGIAAYGAGTLAGEVIGKKMLANTAKKQLEELSNNATSLKIYCNIVRKQINAALKDLSTASNCISSAEKKIVNQKYKTKKKNLKRIRERKAEIESMRSSLKVTIKVVDCIYNNLKLIA